MSTTRPDLPRLDFNRIGPSVGRRFPDVELPNQNGELVDLHARRGESRAIVAFFRSARWCPYCKTELVELQEAKADFEKAGFKIFAVSYDSPATLSDFANKHGITYDLLSDEGSKVIKALGLLNEHLEEQHAYYGVQTREEMRGVPYPGIFVLDEQGVVVEKMFEQSYRVRPNAASILDHILGGNGPEPEVSARAESAEIDVAAWVASATYRPYQKIWVNFSIAVDPDLHVYARPVPEGFTPLQIRFEPLETLEVGPIELPEPRPMKMEGFEETFYVHEGKIKGGVWMMLSKNLEDTEITMRVRYQACTTKVCYPPAELSLALPLKGLDLIRD